MGCLYIYYRASTGSISKKCMNEDSVALIMCEKCVYRIRILKKQDLELSADIFFKRYFLSYLILCSRLSFLHNVRVINILTFSVQRQAESVTRDVGNVSILINNAGTVHGQHVIDITEEDFEYSLRVNTLAHIWVRIVSCHYIRTSAAINLEIKRIYRMKQKQSYFLSRLELFFIIFMRLQHATTHTHTLQTKPCRS